MPNPFIRHPAQVGETYVQHLLVAGKLGLRLIGAGIVCLLHALLPFAFERSGSETVARLHAELARRCERDGPGSVDGG